MKKILLIIVAVAVFLLVGSVYIVDQREQVLVLQFGRLVRVDNPYGKEEPGLKFKLPYMLQTVERFDKRLLDLNMEPQELILGGDERVVIDAFAKFRIVDPFVFRSTVQNMQGLKTRLEPILQSRLREIVGKRSLVQVLSKERNQIIGDVQRALMSDAKDFGVQIVDVRIVRSDLPTSVSAGIHRSMRSNYEKISKEIRAQGEEQVLLIRGDADKQTQIILAEAKQKGQITRGEGDAEAARIFAEAFGKDREFFKFYRTMEAYRRTMQGQNTKFILSPDSEFFEYIKDSNRK